MASMIIINGTILVEQNKIGADTFGTCSASMGITKMDQMNYTDFFDIKWNEIASNVQG